ncbi:hypothetical protein KJ673_01540 [Patescibacteria group bacterium]|nr:hypothetical protein [Patescibacteria group bacterium]
MLCGFIKKKNKISQKELIKARSRKKKIDLT